MSLAEFKEINQSPVGFPGWGDALLEQIYTSTINKSIHDTSNRKYYDMRQGKWVSHSLVGGAFGSLPSFNPMGLIPGQGDRDAKARAQKLHPNPLEELRRMTKLPANISCMDCPRQGPHLHVVMEYKTFVCSPCAQLHGKLQHDVRSITQAEFTTDEIQELQVETIRILIIQSPTRSQTLVQTQAKTKSP